MTWRFMLAFAAATVGCMQPRTKPRVVTAAAPTPVVAAAPTPSCAEAPTSNAAAFPATVMLTPTPGWNEVTPEVTTSPTDVAPAGTPIPATTGAPALKYAALDGATCLAELKKRNVPFATASASTGVDTPVRLSGKVRGVDIHGFDPPAKRATSVWEIVDCRLVLAIDDFAQILAKHDVVEAIHMSMYRPPPASIGKNSKAKPARHDAALAIDLGSLVKKDGTKLRVLEDWHGGIGQKTCGAGAKPSPATKEAVELRTILCEAADAQVFNVVLTPNYNKPHANHFHLEITRGVKWFLVH